MIWEFWKVLIEILVGIELPDFPIMPASPAMRISPGRGFREDNHKRGRSLESGIRFLEKDDDLALFNEAQHKERENFLLQQNDDFDDVFSTKLRYFSDYKLGISIPARGESSDLLNAEGDKNDYDWLITPPETPLFPSLDDEVLPASLVPRGRPRSQPISISRSSTMEKGYRSARGSASPHRNSPSPRSGTSPIQPRNRPFSSAHSSPPPTLGHSYPSRRLSPPPSKPAPTPASRTATPRRMSTGSASVTTPSRVRGTSPIKTSRGHSTSPKIKAWQSNLPGFSLEAPPNLRTSLADRPASCVRGSSPASRTSSRSGRQSMSPTASRSASSSHSHEREQFSSYSRGSIVSSFDDEVDSLQSIPISSSDRSAPRSTGSFPNNRSMGFSKKPTKTLSSAAPKRSFDLALRQMERKGPQNMFRPLLSSVPSSTFYAGKVNAHHRPLTSRNSSITTSSNASSELGMGTVIDTEESELNQEDVAGDGMKRKFPAAHDEVFVMDQADAATETVENTAMEESPGYRHSDYDGPSAVIAQLGVAESSSRTDTATALDSDDVILDRKYDSSDVDGTPDVEVCFKCGGRFHLSELVMERDLLLCQQCKTLEENSTEIAPGNQAMAENNVPDNFVQTLEDGVLKDFNPTTSTLKSLQVGCAGEISVHCLDNVADNSKHPYGKPDKGLSVPLIEELQEINRSVDGDSSQQSLQSGNYSNSKVDVSDGTGISLVLKRPISNRGRLVQSRSFTASNTSYEDFSYVRDSLTSMRSSIGRSSASVSSSVDLGSSRQTEARIQRQSSGQKSDMESFRHETPSKHKRSISSLSGASGRASQAPSVAPSYPEDTFEAITRTNFNEVEGSLSADLHDQSLAYECTEAESICTDDVESSILYKTASELSSHLKDGQPGDSSLVPSSIVEEPALQENRDDPGSTQKEEVAQSSYATTVDIVEVPYPSSLDAISEMEIENADSVSGDLHSDIDSQNSTELQEPPLSVACDDDITAAVDANPANVMIEESTRVSEDISAAKSRTLTLEEATDSILFCRSIIHDLAYEAANIALDKESPAVEPLRPTQRFVNQPSPTHVRKRGVSKSKKARHRTPEGDTKLPSTIDESNAKSTPPRMVISPSKVDTVIPPKLESKCNCTIM